MEEIVVQPTQDPAMMVFHTQCELHEGPPSVGSRLDSSELCEMGKLFLNVRGVEKVAVQAYTVTVLKNPAFAWKPIQDEIVGILKSYVLSNRLLNVDYKMESKEESWRKSLLEEAEKKSTRTTRRGRSGPSKQQS